MSCARPWNRGPMWRRSWATCSSPPSRWGRFAGLDSEQALHGTCEKFTRRFRRVEELAGGRPLDSLGLHRLEELWQQAKQDEA